MLTRHNYLWYLQEVTKTRAKQKMKTKNPKRKQNKNHQNCKLFFT